MQLATEKQATLPKTSTPNWFTLEHQVMCGRVISCFLIIGLSSMKNLNSAAHTFHQLKFQKTVWWQNPIHWARENVASLVVGRLLLSCAMNGGQIFVMLATALKTCISLVIGGSRSFFVLWQQNVAATSSLNKPTCSMTIHDHRGVKVNLASF